MITIRNILSQKGYRVYSISPDLPALEGLQMMADRDVGALVVLENNHLAGMVSERDYARKTCLRGQNAAQMKVADIMSTRVFAIQPEQSIDEAMELMISQRIRHLPVVEASQVIGVLSIMDVVRAVVAERELTIRFYEDIEMEL